LGDVPYQSRVLAEETPEHLCLDKGYGNRPSREVVKGRSYVPHIRRIGEEKLDEAGEKRYPARRWVAERTLGWLSKCRAILTRYQKKAANYLGPVEVACILLWYRRLCQEAGGGRSLTV
jgi:putative transposase